MAIATIALLLIAFLPVHLTHFAIAWRMALCGMGFGIFMSPNARLIMHSVPHERAASAGGLISTTRLMGQTLGATVLASLLAMGVGSGRTPAFVAAGLAVFVGILSVARLKPAAAGETA